MSVILNLLIAKPRYNRRMCNHPDHCHMKGFLTFLILWLISKNHMTGSEITQELEQRKGHRPSPGTIYPVLKKLKEQGLIIDDQEKRYQLTPQGKQTLTDHIETFFDTFCDIEEMRQHCRCHGKHHHHH